MNTQSVFRLSGSAVVVGALVSVAAHLIDGLTYRDPIAYTSYAMAAGGILVLAGLPGVMASRAQGFGVAGLLGVALVFAANCMTEVFGSLQSAMVDPWLAAQAPKLAAGFGPPPFFAFFNIAEGLLVLGSLLIAIPIVRGLVAPRWPGFVLLASVVIGIPGYFLFALATDPFGNLMGQVPVVLLSIALAGIGYQAWLKPEPQVAATTARPQAASGLCATE